MDRGLDVLIGVWDIDAGQRAAAEIGAKPVQLDLANPASIKAAAEEAKPIDVLVNNAGIVWRGVVKAALNALTVASTRTLPRTIKVNAMCPGWVRTRMGGIAASRSPEEGADTAIWLATLGDDGPTGQFFRDRQRIDW